MRICQIWENIGNLKTKLGKVKRMKRDKELFNKIEMKTIDREIVSI